MLDPPGFAPLQMKRTPEPELMEGLEQAQAYAAANFAAGDQALIERLAVLFPQGLGERLVDLGCGPGNISFRLAERYSGASVLGIDGAAAMLAPALQRLAELPELQGRLRFEQRCLPAADLPGGYTAVVSNSLLHHLHEPAVLWQAVAQLAAPGAFVYIQDLRRPSSAEAVEALVVSQTKGAPEVLRRDYRVSLHAAFTVAEVEQQLQQAGLAAQLQVAPRQERYLEVWGRLV